MLFGPAGRLASPREAQAAAVINPATQQDSGRRAPRRTWLNTADNRRCDGLSEGRSCGLPGSRGSGLGWGALVAMPMLVEVAGLMARVIMMRPGLFRHALVPMAVLIKVAWRVTRMIVMLARNLLYARIPVPLGIEVARRVPRMVMVLPGSLLGALIPMPVLIQVSWDVAGMVVVRSWLFLRHGCSSSVFWLTLRRDGCHERMADAAFRHGASAWKPHASPADHQRLSPQATTGARRSDVSHDMVIGQA